MPGEKENGGGGGLGQRETREREREREREKRWARYNISGFLICLSFRVAIPF